MLGARLRGGGRRASRPGFALGAAGAASSVYGIGYRADGPSGRDRSWGASVAGHSFKGGAVDLCAALAG